MTTKKMRFHPATQNCDLGLLFFPSLLSASHGVSFILSFSLRVMTRHQLLRLAGSFVHF